MDRFDAAGLSELIRRALPPIKDTAVWWAANGRVQRPRLRV
jgi:hypothetical protein